MNRTMLVVTLVVAGTVLPMSSQAVGPVTMPTGMVPLAVRTLGADAVAMPRAVTLPAVVELSVPPRYRQADNELEVRLRNSWRTYNTLKAFLSEA